VTLESRNQAPLMPQLFNVKPSDHITL